MPWNDFPFYLTVTGRLVDGNTLVAFAGGGKKNVFVKGN